MSRFFILTMAILLFTSVASCHGHVVEDPGPAPPASKSCPLAALDSDTNGKLLAKLVKEHQPTSQEKRLAAAILLLLAGSKAHGKIHPALLEPAIRDAAANLTQSWPTLVAASCSGGATAKQSGPLTETPPCGEACEIDFSAIAGDVAQVSLDVLIGGGIDTEGSLIAKLYTKVASAVDNAGKLGALTAEVVSGSLNDADADTILQ